MLAAHKVMFLESPLLTAAAVMGAMLLGLFAGSVAHRIAWRITHGRPALELGTSCHECGHAFAPGESIPLFGWLRLRGACPSCGAALGVDGPASELLCGLVFGSILLRHGLSLVTFEYLALACVLMVISLACLWEYRIPNGCIAMAVIIRLAYLGAVGVTGDHAWSLLLTSLVGAAALGIPFALAVFLSNAMLARDVTGMGTVKLIAVVGLYLGWQQGLLGMALAAMLIAVIWVLSPYKMLEVEVEGGAHRKTPEEAAQMSLSPRDLRPTHEEDIAEPMRIIPFAPSICIALWVMLLVGVTPAVWNSPIF